MLSPLALLLTFLASYLLGAIPFGWLIARSRGVDILQQGSGNIGATNVGRVLGKQYGILVFALDFTKGALPVYAAWQLAASFEDWPREAFGVAAGIAAFLGHLYPVYLGFRGGKGVATGAGVVLVLAPLATLAALLVWLLAIVLTRYVSVASIAGAVALCVVQAVGTPLAWAWPHNIVSGFCLLAAGLVVVKHRSNLSRLYAGTENRFPESTLMMLLGKTLHVLALGLWFGTLVFFSLAGYLMFEEFRKETSAARSDNRWPGWFVLPDSARDTANQENPELLSKERASRAFGTAVTPLFPWYFGIQLVCAVVAYGTAIAWQRGREKEKVQRWRTWLLLLALLVTLGAWWMDAQVSSLRAPRNRKTDLVLTTTQPSPAAIADAEQARAEFGKWHAYSLLLNFATLILVGGALALAAQLPALAEKDFKES